MTTSRPAISATLMTPEVADSLLRGNRYNRAIRKAWVSFLANEIRNGRWKLTSSAIAIAPDGRVLNGQHRLMAIVEAGIPAMVMLALNMPEDGFVAEDRGIGRTVADVTSLEPEFVADVTMLIMMMGRVGVAERVSPQVVVDAQTIWRPVYDRLMAPDVNFGKRRGASSSSLRVGVGLRWAIETTPARREYVLRQYTAYGRSETQEMSKAIHALARRFTDPGWMELRSHSATNRIMAAMIYWVHFDPERKNVPPAIRDKQAMLTLVRKWTTLLEDAYAAGPTKDGHPYLFAERPTLALPVFGAAAIKVAKKAAKG